MRYLVALLIFLTTIAVPTYALPNSPVVCDRSTGLATIQKKHNTANNGANTQITVSASTVAVGAPTPPTISLTNGGQGFTGFLIYVLDSKGAHAGTLAPQGAAQNAASPCVNGQQSGTTYGHNSQAFKQTLSWTWTPTTPGTYQVTAMVGEQQGLPTLFNLPQVTITVTAAAVQTPAPTQPPTPKPTTPPTTPPTAAPTTPAVITPPAGGTTTQTQAPPVVIVNTPAPTQPATTTMTTAPTTPATTTTTTAPTTTTTVQQLFNTVLVRLRAVLNGTGTLAQLKSAIQALITQLQAAVQKAKAAKKSPNANKPVHVVVMKTVANTIKAQDAGSNDYFQVANAGATGSPIYNIQLGFVDAEDAQVFAESLQQASSLNPTIHAASALQTSGDVVSQLQYDPAGLDANGNVVVAAATVALYTCPDGTQVTQDMIATMCPATTATAAPVTGNNGNGVAPLATTPTATNPISNGAFIGIIIGGVILLMVTVGGLIYYQKRKATTSVAPRV